MNRARGPAQSRTWRSNMPIRKNVLAKGIRCPRRSGDGPIVMHQGKVPVGTGLHHQALQGNGMLISGRILPPRVNHGSLMSSWPASPVADVKAKDIERRDGNHLTRLLGIGVFLAQKCARPDL